jgi:predicted transposase YbfD/YdcC
MEVFEPFVDLTDPRRSNARHLLFDIFVIALCGVISGAEGWEDLEDYGHAQAQWFQQFFALPHGIPSHDPFGRVFSRLNPDEVTHRFIEWTEALRDKSGGELVSIDGKMLRRSFDRAASKAAIHMVSAWAGANRLVLGQVKVDDKSNEITAIPQLLALLDLEGAIVTIEAMGCQKEIAGCLTEHGADDVLALKENHQTLYDNVALLLTDIEAGRLPEMTSENVETVNGGHGRIETRRYWITSDIACLGAKASWPG